MPCFSCCRWADGNDAVWEAAQHVSGWGRIHAVAQLEPGSDAIRRWLLLEGWRNNVAPDYSALTCVEKSGLAEALHSGALDSAEFTAAGELLPYLLSEGPVAGISALENSGVFLQDYLTLAEAAPLPASDFEARAVPAGLLGRSENAGRNSAAPLRRRAAAFSMRSRPSALRRAEFLPDTPCKKQK